MAMVWDMHGLSGSCMQCGQHTAPKGMLMVWREERRCCLDWLVGCAGMAMVG